MENHQTPCPRPKIYASKSITKYIQCEIDKRFVKSGLNIKCVPNGVIATGPTDNCFGVFDKDGVFVKESLSLREKKGQIIPPASALANPAYCDDDVVYLGNLRPVFGHYLLEHWDRAYAFLDEKYRDMKFVLANDRRVEPIPNFVLELARLLGMSAENLVILNESTRFRNVYVPEQGFRMSKFSTKEFGEIYAKTADNVKEEATFDKIYVSRAALKHRKTYGEEKVQGIFEKNGYQIVYPEQLSLEEQIALMKGCKSLAGCAGTALHLALFMPPGGNVVQIRRNRLKADNSGTQYLIAETKGLGFVLIDASIEKHKTTHFDSFAQIIGVTGHMKQFFDDNRFKYSPDDLEYDKEAYDEYTRADEKIKAELGRSRFEKKMLGKVVKLMACFIFNRQRRSAFRNRIKKAWGIWEP